VSVYQGKSTPEIMSRRYTLFRRAMISLFQFFFGLEMRGQDRVPKGGPLIVAANHTQYLDPVLVCMAIPRRMQWMAKKQLFQPPYDRLFRFIGSFPVDREGGGRSGVRSALAYLTAGWALGIFPEGTHKANDDGSARAAKSGAVVLAIRGNAPVVPVFVGRIPDPIARLRGERLRLIVGEPIRMDDKMRGGKAYREAADEVLQTIYALPKEASPQENRT
jgi:1-acyl-sn-glycerol-3-phosphate acyltransferase